MRLIDADRLLDRCKFYHLPNGDLAVPIIDVQHAPTVDTTTHDSIPAKTGENDGVGTSGDCISRQAAIDFIDAGHLVNPNEPRWSDNEVVNFLKSRPSAQPEIIYCKDCVKHNKGHGYYYDGTVIGIKDCCPLVEIRGRAQGHEFDYQFCAYPERRTDD